MTIDKIVVGDSVLVKAGVRSSNRDDWGEIRFSSDRIGKVLFVREGYVTVNFPDYHKLAIYEATNLSKVKV